MANYEKIITILMALFCMMVSHAQLSTLVLHDGSRLRGYISVQRPGKNITFHSIEAEMYVKDKDLIFVSSKTFSFELLPVGWRRYALQHDALAFDGKTWCLPLETIVTVGGVHEMVHVIERGISVRYVQYAEDDYNLRWSDIAEISKDVQTDGTEGFYDEVALYDGTVYTGSVIGQSPGKSMKVKERNGNVTVINQAQVKSSRKVPTSADVNLWSVRPYTNVLRLEDNSTREGLIIYQQSGKTADDSFIDILKENGMQERIHFMDIKEYQYLLRGELYDGYKKDNIYIDEIAAQKSYLTSLNGYMYTTDTLSNVIYQGLPVYIKARGSKALNGWKLMKMKRLSLEKGSVVLGFKKTMVDFIPTIDTKDRQVTDISLLNYGALAEGCYVFMNQSKTEFYVINIKSIQ